MKTLVILNHPVNQDQKSDLVAKGYASSEEDILILDKELHTPFKNIDPSLTEIYDSMFSEIAKVREHIIRSDADFVWIQGEFSFFWEIATFCEKHDIGVIISTTKREVVEKQLEDGSIEKKMIFKHVAFRRLNF